VANIKSQIKRNKQNDKRRLRNRVYRGTARIAVKNARAAIDSGVPESQAALVSAISALDKAAEQVLFTEIMPPAARAAGKGFCQDGTGQGRDRHG